ncbi:MAG: tetratricopeptide repeat protein [Chitinophagaceae bacterium]|nr:MAG: tetratricopeptide repeat protein [Chitinophagaceae bacterium]
MITRKCCSYRVSVATLSRAMCRRRGCSCTGRLAVVQPAARGKRPYCVLLLRAPAYNRRPAIAASARPPSFITREWPTFRNAGSPLRPLPGTGTKTTAMRTNTLLLLAFLGLASTLSAQSKRARIDSIVRAYHRYGMFDGAVLVAEGGLVLYEGAFGPANREWNIPNRTDTKFMIGSISKPLTAVLVLLQVQKGLLALDSTLAHYLPEFRNKPAGRVTVRQLLAHTSGMPNYDIIRDFFPRISRSYFSRADYLRVFIDSALVFEPGTRYAYSSWGYFTLGYLVERVTGKSYAGLMREELFRPLRMNRSGSYAHTQIVAGRASGYDYRFGTFASADFRDQSNTMGTGDIYSTVGDLFRFHLALSGGSLLRDDLRAAMFTPGMAPAHYGLGWFNKPFTWGTGDSVASNFHLGMTDGFIAFIRRIPATNSVVVLLCNSAPTDFFGISNNLLKVLYGQPVLLKEPVHKLMERRIGERGAQAAVAAYRGWRADSARYGVDWISMNFLAQQLLEAKRYDDARIISENNLAEFPEKDLVQVTMGNIYLALGRKEDAARCFRNALRLNPAFDEARNRLRELEAQ